MIAALKPTNLLWNIVEIEIAFVSSTNWLISILALARE